MTSNYRGISIILAIARLFSSIPKEKIIHNMSCLGVEQSCFRKERSYIDNSHCIQQIAEKNIARNIETQLTFIDMEKAFDSVPRNRIVMGKRTKKRLHGLLCNRNMSMSTTELIYNSIIKNRRKQ